MDRNNYNNRLRERRISTNKSNESEDFKAKEQHEASVKLEALAANNNMTDSVYEPTILSTELSNMSILFEDYFTADKIEAKVNKKLTKC